MSRARVRQKNRPFRRIAALGGACLGALFLLTACIDVNADVTVNSDATGTGTFELVLQKQAASMLGITSADQLGTQIASEDSGGIPGMGNCTSGENDAGYTYSCTFTNVAFTNGDGPWTITKSGDTITFAMKGNATGDLASAEASASPSASDDLSTLLGGASLGTMTVKVAFPGPISSVSGSGVEQTSDTSATISSDLSKTVDVSITAAASSGGSLSASMIIVLLVALAVLVLIVVVVIVMVSRRNKRPTGPPIQAPGIPNAAEVVAGATATAVVAPVVAEEVAEAVAPEAEAETVAEAPVEEAEAVAAPEAPAAPEAAPEAPVAETTPEAPAEAPDSSDTPPAEPPQ